MSTELDTSVIPEGLYCYRTGADNEPGVCPYWSLSSEHPDQANGFCAFLNTGDWMEHGSWLLWDQIKECDINNNIEHIFAGIDAVDVL